MNPLVTKRGETPGQGCVAVIALIIVAVFIASWVASAPAHQDRRGAVERNG